MKLIIQENVLEKIKKVFCSIFLLSVIITQAQSYEQKQVDFNLGVGVGNTYLYSGNYFGSGFSYRSLPLFSLSGDYGITDAISIGGILGFSTATSTYSSSYSNGSNQYNYTDTYRWSFTLIGLRGAYHFAELIDNDKLDLYAGGMLGFIWSKAKYSSTASNHPYTYNYGSSGIGMAYSAFVGCRYRFTDQLGVFGELGYGVSILNIGITYKRD